MSKCRVNNCNKPATCVVDRPPWWEEWGPDEADIPEWIPYCEKDALWRMKYWETRGHVPVKMPLSINPDIETGDWDE